MHTDEDRTVSFYIKEWMQNRKEPGKGIWEIKLSDVIIFCHCNADIKSDLSWENMSGNFKWDRYLLKRNGKYYVCCARKSKEIPEAYSLKEAIYDLGVLEGRKVHRAMVCPEYVLSGKDWMYYIHCLLIEIILYKYGSS